jgi:DNA polymerase II large subunit
MDDLNLKGLCMRCRDDKNKPTMQTMKDVAVEEKNNRFSAKGTCTTCGGNMFKFLSKDDAAKYA